MMAPIQSLRRSMKILALMSRGGKTDYTLAELAAEARMPASSVYRILQTFALDQYVLADGRTHTYRLGPALVPLCQTAGEDSDLKRAAMPYLEEMAARTGDDAFLMTVSGFHSRTLAKAEGPGRIKIVATFEGNTDLHCGANRKLLLAYQSEDFIDAYIARGLKAYTAQTITDRDRLLAELRAIREEGVSFSLGEFIEGAMGFSAPVRDRTGAVIASMGTTGPAIQVTAARINAQKKVVADCAARLSEVLGYRAA